MNKTQKGAWFSLFSALFCIGLLSYGGVRIFVFKSMPRCLAVVWTLGIYFVFMVISMFFLSKKQSPVEVEADERDKLIMKRAVLACFISIWVFLAAISVIPRLIVGIDGSIPVWLIPIMNLGVLFAAMLVYSVAVLVQYGWIQKGEKS
ncbi:MAG: hypothetical protein ACYSWP_00275 [Planctomycetota bacterium]|jgi:hypothetical protein